MPPRRHDRGCSIRGCIAEFYALDLCKRHYYRLQRHNNPTAFQIARKYDQFDANGNRWCISHKTWVPPEQFNGSERNRCRTCRRLEKYDLTLDQFAAMVARTGELCPLCRKRPADAIDHDHVTGKVRGLLCKQCNIAIGTITEEGIVRAMQYLAGRDVRTPEQRPADRRRPRMSLPIRQHGGRTLNEAAGCQAPSTEYEFADCGEPAVGEVPGENGPLRACRQHLDAWNSYQYGQGPVSAEPHAVPAGEGAQRRKHAEPGIYN